MAADTGLEPKACRRMRTSLVMTLYYYHATSKKYIFAPIMSNNTDEIFKNVIAHAKEYGFVFPSSEIYDGLSAVYDYGQFGAELKNNIKTYWWKAMVQMNENIVGIDSAIFMHPKIWEASGHVAGFNDPM